jgi:FtsP/CotA-like multicopper oxidase with cupredoxin domain
MRTTPDQLRRRAALGVALATALMLWQHLLDTLRHGHLTTPLQHAQAAFLDVLIAIPAAVAAIWLADLAVRHTRADGRTSAAHAAAVSLFCVPLMVPLGQLQPIVHGLFVDAAAGHHASAGGGTLVGAIWYAIGAQPVAFAVALLTGERLGRRPVRRRRWARRVTRAVVLASASLLVVGMIPQSASAAAAAAPRTVPDRVAAAAAVGECGSVPRRQYDVSAINLDITVNRHGDHDPFGFMYVLNAREADVRAQEAALRAAARAPDGATTGAKVSIGLAQDPIQPLVLRARVGDCVVINLTNKLTQPPKGGPGFQTTPIVTQPGGVPSVSIDMQGVAYSAAAGEGGDLVGNNPASVMVPPGATRTYRFYLDPLLGEGARVFRSGGNSVQTTAHGLFGALVAEPAGSTWSDPRTGQDRTSDVSWNSWEAMVRPPNEPAFREFTLMYHEIGDENFNLRRPPREGAPQPATPDPGDGEGAPLPMIDETGQATGGANTKAYRPGSRGLNYRSEPFMRRLNSLAAAGKTDAQMLANESLAYGSYMFGDSPTPMPRSYLGEPTKTRLVHPGFEQLHVHHLHGGATRWRQNPDADNTDMAGGLRKVPVQNASSIRLDSQTIGPEETYNLEHECGAGGCQQAAGDFLFHCHIAHHYIAGMWSFWRVFDTRQADLATLPGRAQAPAAVDSAGLLGRQIGGRTVVLRANVTNASTQVALEDLVESQIPPQGVRVDDEDATVWNWTKEGTATAPVYKGEPEDTRVWANFSSTAPGVRPAIQFNPTNGRPAWPMLRPHFAQRPPFSPNGHSGAPWLGENGSAQRPDGLCPSGAPLKTYNVTAVSLPVRQTVRETDAGGRLFVLNEDKQALLNGTRPPDPLTIRSNVGDCVAVTFSSELNPAGQEKVNMHTHFVQFDPQASDGVISGFSYEQSIYSDAREDRTATAATAAGATTINVTNVDRLRPGISIGVGVGRPNIEIRRITGISGNTLTFDRALTNAHAVGDPVTVEFVQYRWYSDVDSGTVFWHDHVDGIQSWAHGLFGAHIIEPAGSTYHDPRTGAQVRSGTIVDIRTSRSVGVGTGGSFREFMLFLGNGRQGRPELDNPAFFGILGQNRNFGQECEEGWINLRAAPIGERVPPGSTPADPATTDQRQEFSGAVCRSTTSNQNVPDGSNTVNATVATVDPYAFSSVKYGDPGTPLLRAYVGDPVVIRTIGLNERGEALRMQGHRFRVERFNAAGELTDTATTGISERFDYILDGGAGGPGQMPGDYLYHSARNFAFETGAWGIFRVHDRRSADLAPLPDRAAPPTGTGFPLLSAATGNTQQAPGPNPPPATQSGVVSSTRDPCPAGVPQRAYDVSLINVTLPTAPVIDTEGVIYALTSDVAGIRSGQKPVEPLVLRVNRGDCLQVTLRNQVDADSRYGGRRGGFDLSKLPFNPQTSGGGAVGLNPDTTVAIGGSVTYRAFADRDTGTSIFRNLGSEVSQRHGAYGLLIVEPTGSTWFNSANNAPLGATATSTQAIIRGPGTQRFREFALTLSTTDQHYSRSIVPYQDVVAGTGVNSTFTAGNPPVADKGFTHVSYHSEPITVRLGLTSSPPNPSPNYGTAFSSAVHGDPATPVFRAYAGDPVVYRLGIGASDQLHNFTIAGHMFPKEPNMWNGTTDRRSALLSSRTVTAGETLDAEIVGGAGGPPANTGDYMYRDGRQPFTEAGMWGIFRVVPSGTTLGDLARL